MLLCRRPNTGRQLRLHLVIASEIGLTTESVEEHHGSQLSNDKTLTHKYVVQWQGAEYLRQEFTLEESLENVSVSRM
jgi:hypothetical protein